VRFTLTAHDPIAGLTLSLPAPWDGAVLTHATAGSAPLPVRRQSVHEAERAFVTLSLAAEETQTIEVVYKEERGSPDTGPSSRS
jgi:hypothetical protein